MSCGHDDTGDLGPKKLGFLLLLGAPADCNKETDAQYTRAEEQPSDGTAEEGRRQSDQTEPLSDRSKGPLLCLPQAESGRDQC